MKKILYQKLIAQSSMFDPQLKSQAPLGEILHSIQNDTFYLIQCD